MPRKCVVKHCQSNVSGSPYTPTFTIPFKEHTRWTLWKSKIRESSEQYLKIIETDTVCIKHFEERFIVRGAINSDNKKKPQRSKYSLTKDAYPTLDMESRSREQSNETELTSDFISNEEAKKTKAKRGSSGLANLQKARMRKLLRRERMKSLIKKRAEDRKEEKVAVEVKPPITRNLTEVKKTIVKVENTRTLKSHVKAASKDFFLSDRQPSKTEHLLVSLRLTSHFHSLHNGSKICKDKPSSINDVAAFPTFNIIKQIDSLKQQDKNPVDWSVDETYRFVRKISSSRGVAELFKNQCIDGEALLNLNCDDLRNYLSLDSTTSESLAGVFSQLRREVLQRYTLI